MNSLTKKQELILKKSDRAKLQSLRFILPLLLILGLAACNDRMVAYKGTCAQQTRQFMDYMHSFVIDELTPVIQDGFDSGSDTDVMKRIEKLDARISKLNTPKCNPDTLAVKDSLRLYMLETRNYFSTVAGRAIYGEGAVQAQLSKMSDAGWDFQVALEDLQK